MPQMMPLNWILALLMFISIFILFNILNYYLFNIKKMKNNYFKNYKSNNFFWKW